MTLSACAATVKLAANERKMISVRTLASTEPVSTLAARHGVSRPLVCREMYKANAALDELFSPARIDGVDKVAHQGLFTQPLAAIRLAEDRLWRGDHSNHYVGRLWNSCAVPDGTFPTQIDSFTSP